MKELIEIRSKLSVPKTQWNDHSKFNYRSCEDILEALKPHLKEKGCLLTINDELVLIGERYYIKATVHLVNVEGMVVQNVAYAREAESRKGMSADQLTGSTSSYARKYALNGLFLIDDTKDADATNDHGKGYQEETTKPPLNKDGIKGADGRKYIAGFESAEQALEQLRKTRTLDSEDRTLVIDIWHAERGDADTEWAGDK